MREHERFLHKFTIQFKMFDTNLDGVLNELEFRSLVISLGVLQTDAEIQNLLELVDPYNN